MTIEPTLKRVMDDGDIMTADYYISVNNSPYVHMLMLHELEKLHEWVESINRLREDEAELTTKHGVEMSFEEDLKLEKKRNAELIAKVNEFQEITKELRAKVPENLLGYLDSFQVVSNVNSNKDGTMPKGVDPVSQIIVTFNLPNKMMSIGTTMLRSAIKNKGSIPTYIKALEEEAANRTIQAQRLEGALDVMEAACGLYRGIAEKAFSALLLAESADTPEDAQKAKKAQERAKETLATCLETSTAGKKVLKRFKSMSEALEERQVDLGIALLKEDAKIADELGIDEVLG